MGPDRSPVIEVKLVVTDVDGTLLNSLAELSPATRRAVGAARALGIPMLLATGKSPVSIAPLADDLDLDGPHVCSQGMVICDRLGTVVDERFVPPALVDAVTDVAKERGLHWFAYSGCTLYTDAPSTYREVLHDHYGEPVAVIGAPRRDHVNKLIVWRATGVGDDDRTALDHAVATVGGTVVQAVPETIEILQTGMSKGAAVLRLLNQLGVDPATVMAVGDAENDIEMLAGVGLGVAMGQAHPAVRAAAAVTVAGNDDDGLAEAFDRFVFGRRSR